jgi:hypothetical protein
MPSIKYHARNATAKYKTTALSAIVSTSTLAAQMTAGTGVAFTSILKDVTIVPPEGAVEKVDFLGETSGFQNAMFEEKAYAAASISGTMVIDSAETLELLFGGAGTAVTGGFTRFQYGTSTAGATRIKVGAVFVGLDNGTNSMNILMNNIMVTKLGDIKPTGTDGHWERGFEAMCLPADYYEEFKD